MFGAFARSAWSAFGARYAHRIEQPFELGTAVALTGGEYHAERAALAVAGEVQLGGEATFAASQRLVFGVQEPLFSSCSLGSRLAPAACW